MDAFRLPKLKWAAARKDYDKDPLNEGNAALNRILKLYRIATNLRFARALLRGCAATIEHESVIKGSDFKFVVDIGANRGQFAVAVREHLPSAVIHCIEPLAEPSLILRQVMGRDEGLFLHRCAVGAQNQSAFIRIAVRDHSSSLLEAGSHQLKLFPFTAQREVRPVAVLPLGDVIEPQSIQAPALLKIDVQGYELEVLRGCADMLSSFSCVYVECAFVELYVGQALAAEIIEFLGAAGFRLQGIYDAYYDRQGHPIQADLLFAAARP